MTGLRRCGMYVCVCIYIYIFIYIYTHIHTHTHTHNGILVIKKNEIFPFAATWMDLENIILSEVRERQKLFDITYMWNLKNNTNESIYKTETDSQT